MWETPTDEGMGYCAMELYGPKTGNKRNYYPPERRRVTLEASDTLIRWSRWAPNLVEFGQMSRADVQKHIQRFEQEAKKLMDNTGADHVLYARKIYSENERLEEVRFYLIPMTDEKFERDVVPLQHQQVYALHKQNMQK